MSTYKNYGKKVRSDGINAPYRKHEWKKIVEAVSDKADTQASVHFGKSKFLGYMVYDTNTGKIYATDRQESVIKTFEKDLNQVVRKVKVGNSIKYYNDIGQNPNGALLKPVPICCNSLGHLIVGDHGKKVDDKNIGKFVVYKINEYEENSKNDIENFETITTIEHDDIRTPSCMEIEDDGVNRFRLYVTDWFNNNVTIWQLDYEPVDEKYKSKLLGKIDVIAPSSVRVSRSNFFVISEVSWEWKYENFQVQPGERKILKVTHGLNAIHVFNKLTFEEDHVIKLDNFFNPRGLYIDKENKIYTTAYKLSERENIPVPDFDEYKKGYFQYTDQSNKAQFTSNFHSERYNGRTISPSANLIILNINGDVLQETVLGIEFIGDFLVFQKTNDYKIVFMSARGDPTFNLMEFRELDEYMDE